MLRYNLVQLISSIFSITFSILIFKLWLNFIGRNIIIRSYWPDNTKKFGKFDLVTPVINFDRTLKCIFQKFKIFLQLHLFFAFKVLKPHKS